jgi:hypothetical protein
MAKNQTEFDPVKSNLAGMNVWRAKVPGGWLVYLESKSGGTQSQSSFFYPDAQHDWDGASLEMGYSTDVSKDANLRQPK